MQDVFLSLRNVRKEYPGVLALDDCSLDFYRGEVHALVGENGAGKSTMIKSITGATSIDAGSFTVDGIEYGDMTTALARDLGIAAIYQDCKLYDSLSAAENIFFGKKFGKFVNQKEMNSAAAELFARYGIDIEPGKVVNQLSIAQMQLVAITKAVSQSTKLLIMDEPTAPLTANEVEILFRMIAQMKEEGITIIYISHRLDEIFQVSDRVTVMRDGRVVETCVTAETDRNDLIRLMVGRELSEQYPTKKAEIGTEALRLDHVTTEYIEDVSFCAHYGEILGISGLVGSGRTEILQAVYGLDRIHSGRVYVNGKAGSIHSTGEAIGKYKIGIVPEDRKKSGVFLSMDIAWNITFNNLRAYCKGLLLKPKLIREDAEKYKEKMNVKTPDLSQRVSNLSGGNQQKVAIAKSMAAQSDILFLDEPTSGIDVGSKYEIYCLMNEMAEQGKCIIMISSDMEELLGMSDRIVVMYEGRLTGELSKEQFSQENVLKLASGQCDSIENGEEI